MRRCWIILFLSLQLASFAGAQAIDESVSVTARFDRTVSSEDEVVQLIVTIAAQTNLNDIDVRLPELADFETLGEQTSRQFSQINNRVEISFSYLYTLLPKRSGTLRVPSFEVLVQGKTYRTEPLTLHVSKGQSITDILVRQRPNKQRAYVGEQIVVSLEILFRIGIDSYEITEEVQPQGFIIEYDESINPNSLTDTVEVGGVPYRRAIIRRSILFPISAGTKRLEEIDFLFRYRPQRFDFNRRVVKVSTEPVNLEILPLPEPVPESFTGAVGDFSVDWSIDSSQGTANEPLTLSISLSGVGDLERAPDIRPALPPNFEILEGSVSAEAHYTNGFWGGSKQWDYIIIPKRSGEQVISPLQFSFFDPNSESYLQSETQPISLNIAEAERTTTTTLPTPIDTEAAEGDIRYIGTGTLRHHDNGFVGGLWFWALIIAPPALNLLFLALRAFIGTLGATDVRGIRRRAALTEALNKLKRVGKIADRSAALTSLRNAVLGYFADKMEMEVDAASLTLADIRAEMVRRDLHEEPAFNTLADVILACESEQYSPVASANAASSGELSHRAADALNTLDRRL